MIINEHWISATDALVAELLLHLKRSSSSSTPTPTPTPFYPPGWGDRKSRSRSQQHRTDSPSSDLFSANRSLQIDTPQHLKKECELESKLEMTKKTMCMLPDLNETPSDE
ncbi:hypothetical protein QVD17_32460 [Tagetes erecta]|uniref:Uncharacterized protein n=1 Tax=Tagetes erecta TaxID=13708 RepID=A0AAD8NKT2_TARER|nr:hypothetical protein QVD17_32460 [Tagetes erecta]